MKVYRALINLDEDNSGFYLQLTHVQREDRRHQPHLIKVTGIGASELRKRYFPDISEIKIQDALTELTRDQASLVSKVGFDNKQ